MAPKTNDNKHKYIDDDYNYKEIKAGNERHRALTILQVSELGASLIPVSVKKPAHRRKGLKKCEHCGLR